MRRSPGPRNVERLGLLQAGHQPPCHRGHLGLRQANLAPERLCFSTEVHRREHRRRSISLVQGHLRGGLRSRIGDHIAHGGAGEGDARVDGDRNGQSRLCSGDQSGETVGLGHQTAPAPGLCRESDRRASEDPSPRFYTASRRRRRGTGAASGSGVGGATAARGRILRSLASGPRCKWRHRDQTS